ncbi:MAG TPA: GTPase [Vicinamibacterales bacterium]|nr:GTPase [Vicinamibacterales bacterium]
MRIEASFVRSAARAGDLPRDGLRELAMVGRSNVGKSSLINALVRRTVARTSAVPGKTRLANVYRVRRGDGSPFYLVDLPGYGYARGDRADIDAAIEAFFSRAGRVSQVGRVGQVGRNEDGSDLPGLPELPDPPDLAAILLVDARHPGLASDIAAWQWLRHTVERSAVAATKIDKLARGERSRALGELESVLETSVLPVSAATGEGLDELWKLIERLPSNRRPPLLNSSSHPLPRATATPRRPRQKSWSSRRSKT